MVNTTFGTGKTVLNKLGRKFALAKEFLSHSTCKSRVSEIRVNKSALTKVHGHKLEELPP